MGKSPGRWIKKVLLGKKSSKTHMAKGREKPENHKEYDMFSSPPVISDPIPITSSLSERNLEIKNSDSVDSQNNGGMSLKENQDAKSEVSLPQLASSYEKKTRQDGAAATEAYPLPPVISNPIPSEMYLEHQNRDSVDLQNNGGMSSQRNQDKNSEVSIPQLALSNEEKIRQEEAATVAQAAFRGFQARREFRDLKGIIRLQALIRGGLVRRQAVATLFCMWGIVKLQAISRGIKARNSDIGQEISKTRRMVKVISSSSSKLAIHVYQASSIRTANAFVLKLVASSPTVMPLHLYYDSSEPNSVQNWVERWTVSNFWKPIPQPKRSPNQKSQRQSIAQMLEAETGRPNSTVQRVPASNIDNTSVKTTSVRDKPKHNFRKNPGRVADAVQENPQNEIEKVKRNLRKVCNPVTENAAQPEFVFEKSKDGLEKMSGTAIDNLLVKYTSNSGEKMQKEIASRTPKQPDLPVKNEPIFKTTEFPETEATIDPLLKTGVSEVHNNQAMDISEPEVENCQKDENIPPTNVELNRKDDPVEDDNHKCSKKASYVRKRESAENGLQSSPSVPSYMAATESAKAKLRAQGSPRLSQDGAEKSNSARRHSLPSANSKISSHSPRTRAVHSGGKSKNDRSLSREGNAKVTQTEWRR